MLESPLSKALYVGNGVTTEFPFAFKVWEPTQIEVTVQDDKGMYGVVTGWTVDLTDTGGTVTYLHKGEPLPEGYKLAITRKMPFVQPVDLITGTRFDPAVIEERLDRDCAERQELLEKVGRAILFSATEENVPSAESYIEALGEYFEGASAARDEAVESAEKAEQAYQSTLGTLPQIESVRNAAEQSIDNHRTSAEQSIEIMRKSALEAIDEEGAHYVQLAKNEADRSGTEADRAEEAAERASALADVGIASADKLGLIRLGRGLEIDPNGIVSVRSSITMLAPIVTAPDNLPLGYPAVFTMAAYPGLGNTSIVKYRCTLEGLGTVEVDAEPETGAGEVSFVVPRPVGAGVSKKFSVIAIDTLGNESLPTELTRTTVGASVNAPVILTPEANADVYSSAGFDVTAGEFGTTGTDDTHASTDWLIAKDADGSVFVVQELETSDLYSHTFLPETLANRLEDDTTYYLFARYNGVLLGGSALSAPVAVVARGAFVHAPEVTSPAAFSDVYSAAGFSMATTSEFVTTGVEDTHASTDWLVATDRNGRNVVASALDSEDLKEHTFSAEDLVNVPTDQTVYLFCRFNGAILGKGVLSAGVEVVCKPAGIVPPTIIPFAEDFVFYKGGDLTVSASEFETIGIEDEHISSDWVVSRDVNRQDVVAVFDDSFDLETKTFLQSDLDSIEENGIFYVSVRYRGEALGVSQFSNPIKVVAKAAPTVVIGEGILASSDVLPRYASRLSGIQSNQKPSSYFMNEDGSAAYIVLASSGEYDSDKRYVLRFTNGKYSGYKSSNLSVSSKHDFCKDIAFYIDGTNVRYIKFKYNSEKGDFEQVGSSGGLGLGNDVKHICDNIVISAYGSSTFIFYIMRVDDDSKVQVKSVDVSSSESKTITSMCVISDSRFVIEYKVGSTTTYKTALFEYNKEDDTIALLYTTPAYSYSYPPIRRYDNGLLFYSDTSSPYIRRIDENNVLGVASNANQAKSIKTELQNYLGVSSVTVNYVLGATFPISDNDVIVMGTVEYGSIKNIFSCLMTKKGNNASFNVVKGSIRIIDYNGLTNMEALCSVITISNTNIIVFGYKDESGSTKYVLANMYIR